MVQQLKGKLPASIWIEAIIGQYIFPLPHLRSKPLLSNLPQCLSLLTPDQLHVFNNLKFAKSGLHVLTGPPGTGKTFFISFLKIFWESKGRVVLLTTTTGIVALRLHNSARIVHTAFPIPIKGELQALSRSSKTFDDLSNASVIIINECSMLTTDLHKHVVARLHEVSQGVQCSQRPF